MSHRQEFFLRGCQAHLKPLQYAQRKIYPRPMVVGLRISRFTLLIEMGTSDVAQPGLWEVRDGKPRLYRRSKR